MQEPVMIETVRLQLRQAQLRDARILVALHQQNKLLPWYSGASVSEVTAMEQLLRDEAALAPHERRSRRWVITLMDQPEAVVGMCALLDIDVRHRCARLDFELSHSRRGKGLMHEALTGLLDWAYGPGSLNRVEAWVHHLNLAAIRLLRALRFQQEGCLREAVLTDRVGHDLLLFGLLEREFSAPAAS
jgi:RimJ/RimL family protein N-acetyltransferase